MRFKNQSAYISTQANPVSQSIYSTHWSVESFPQFTLIQDKAIGQVLEIIEFIKNQLKTKNTNNFKWLCELSADQLLTSLLGQYFIGICIVKNINL